MNGEPRMIPAAELELKLREIWHWAVDMVPHSAECSTYGVDAVGRCIELVQRWPDADWETYHQSPEYRASWNRRYSEAP